MRDESTQKTIEERVREAARTGDWATFIEGETVPAALIVELATLPAGHQDAHQGGFGIEGATIDGGLDFEDCALPRPLFFDRCTIAGRIILRRSQAKILSFEGCLDIGTLEGESLQVTGPLVLRGATFQGRVNLAHASVSVLVDDKKSWPAPGKLNLTGFTYGAIYAEAPHTATERLDWLGRQQDLGVFDPQPYEQLAKVLKTQGHDGEARRIQIAKEDDRLKRGTMSRWHRAAWRAYGWLAGYGYRRARPLWWLLGAIVLGTIVFWAADHYEIMVPAKERIYMHEDYVSRHYIPPEYPRPVWPIYSADLLLPFVDLAQDSYWMPAITGKGWAGWAVTIYMWLHIAFGWIASALFVAGITGLVKRD